MARCCAAVMWLWRRTKLRMLRECPTYRSFGVWFSGVSVIMLSCACAIRMPSECEMTVRTAGRKGAIIPVSFLRGRCNGVQTAFCHCYSSSCRTFFCPYPLFMASCRQ